MINICKICGEEFVADYETERYCQECDKDHYNNMQSEDLENN